MSDKTYDIIKNTALFAAPVLAFMGSLVTIWAAIITKDPVIPAAITATLTAIDTLLGGIVLVAKKIYEEKKKGA
jgi:uncharacterized membrane-anchored protein